MKKIIILLLIILVACSGVGVFFGVRSCKKQSAFDTEISILQGEYMVGEKVYFEYKVYSDMKLKNITYELNNGGEQSISNTRSGKVSDITDSDRAYYFDTRVVEIDTKEYTPGWYSLSFFGYDEVNNRYELTNFPYQFKLTAQQ